MNETDGTEEQVGQSVNRFSGMLRTPFIGWIYNILVYLEGIGSEKLINWFIIYMGLISVMFFAGFALHTYQERIQESTEDMLNPEEPLGPWTYSVDQESNEDMLNPEEPIELGINPIDQESTEDISNPEELLGVRINSTEFDF